MKNFSRTNTSLFLAPKFLLNYPDDAHDVPCVLRPAITAARDNIVHTSYEILVAAVDFCIFHCLRIQCSKASEVSVPIDNASDHCFVMH